MAHSSLEYLARSVVTSFYYNQRWGLDYRSKKEPEIAKCCQHWDLVFYSLSPVMSLFHSFTPELFQFDNDYLHKDFLPRCRNSKTRPEVFPLQSGIISRGKVLVQAPNLAS